MFLELLASLRDLFILLITDHSLRDRLSNLAHVQCHLLQKLLWQSKDAYLLIRVALDELSRVKVRREVRQLVLVDGEEDVVFF